MVILREISDDDMDFDWLNPKMYTLYISIPLGGGEAKFHVQNDTIHISISL